MLKIFSSEGYVPGVREFHGEESMDFELNRWLPYMDEAEVREASGRIKSLSDWKSEMVVLGERAEAQGRTLHACTYYRAAEFYMVGEEPGRRELYSKSMRLFDEVVVDWPIERALVPFKGGMLPCLVMRASGNRRETLVIHGGFDSYKEELFFSAPIYAKHGFDVIAFDGPGQGQAFREFGLTMDPEWEEPVEAVLDHFELNSCTLMGFSLGGYLAPRAAANLQRIKRVIAVNQLADFFGVFTSRAGPEFAKQLEGMLKLGEREQVNALVGAMTETAESTSWAINHGLEISGSNDCYEFLKWLTHIRTAPFSADIHQDVLLVGAQEDQIAPISQWYEQIATLTNVKSLTAQLLTRADHAHTHCHVSNLPLLLDLVTTWIDFQLRTETNRKLLPALD